MVIQIKAELFHCERIRACRIIARKVPLSRTVNHFNENYESKLSLLKKKKTTKVITGYYVLLDILTVDENM